MNEAAVLSWLMRTTLGGGLVLLIGWFLLSRLSGHLNRQRLGEASVIAALLVAVSGLLPSWLEVPLPVIGLSSGVEPGPSRTGATEPLLIAREVSPPAEEFAEVMALPLGDVQPVEQATPPGEANPGKPSPGTTPSWSLTGWLLGAYALLAGFMVSRWVLANLAVAWLVRPSKPIPPHLQEVFEEMATDTGSRLRISTRAQSPFSYGLFRPTVVLPHDLVDKATTGELRWVLAHELDHIRRQDTRTCWLFALAGVFFFHLPWLNWLRRQVRLCQEYLADEAAANLTGSPEDYAEFLVNWAKQPARRSAAHPVPALAFSAVTGFGSDLFRRVTMLLKEQKTSSSHRLRRWTAGLAGGLLALGLVAGGVSLKAVAAENKKSETAEKQQENAAPPKNDNKDRKKPERGTGLPIEIEDLLEQFQGGIDEDAMKQMRRQMDEVRRQMDEARKQMEQLRQGGKLVPLQGLDLDGGIVIPNIPNIPNLPMNNMRARAVPPRQPRLGVQVTAPSQTLVDQLELPTDQGLVLEEVGPNSAAGKAGLKSHDVLLEMNGKPVPNKVESFYKMLDEIKPNEPVDAVVLRKGKKETIKGLTLPESKPVAQDAQEQRMEREGFPGLRGRLGRIGGGMFNRGGMTTFNRNNDEFTTKHREGDVSIVIRGRVEQDGAKVKEITIEENGQKDTYESVDKVPAAHKEKVQKLTEMSARGSFRAPFE